MFVGRCYVERTVLAGSWCGECGGRDTGHPRLLAVGCMF